MQPSESAIKCAKHFVMSGPSDDTYEAEVRDTALMIDAAFIERAKPLVEAVEVYVREIRRQPPDLNLRVSLRTQMVDEASKLKGDK
jgi:hypothetical protein